MRRIIRCAYKKLLRQVNDALGDVKNADEAKSILKDIGKRLTEGSF
jgi:hypothetical protein